MFHLIFCPLLKLPSTLVDNRNFPVFAHNVNKIVSSTTRATCRAISGRGLFLLRFHRGIYHDVRLKKTIFQFKIRVSANPTIMKNRNLNGHSLPMRIKCTWLCHPHNTTMTYKHSWLAKFKVNFPAQIGTAVFFKPSSFAF